MAVGLFRRVSLSMKMKIIRLSSLIPAVLLSVVATVACPPSAEAQEFGQHWIASPDSDGYSQTWFRQTYTTAALPQWAQVTVCTTGYAALYVNERNVTGDVMQPYRKEKSNNPVAITYDVTRFLRPDSNTIAVWYAPAEPKAVGRQIAVNFAGRQADGTPFAYASDGNWLCRPATMRLLDDGGELKDGLAYPLQWTSADYAPALWTSAEEVEEEKAEPLTEFASFYPTTKVRKIREPNSFDVEGDSIVYDFGQAFRGWVRVTLREAVPGELLQIGGLYYVCNGTMDEQASRRFTLGDARRVVVCGDEHFRPSQIIRIEAIEIGPDFHSSYLY